MNRIKQLLYLMTIQKSICYNLQHHIQAKLEFSNGTRPARAERRMSTEIEPKLYSGSLHVAIVRSVRPHLLSIVHRQT
jgi:hypothetical protein